jgi:hypothetical protein
VTAVLGRAAKERPAPEKQTRLVTRRVTARVKPLKQGWDVLFDIHNRTEHRPIINPLSAYALAQTQFRPLSNQA